MEVLWILIFPFVVIIILIWNDGDFSFTEGIQKIIKWFKNRYGIEAKRKILFLQMSKHNIGKNDWDNTDYKGFRITKQGWLFAKTIKGKYIDADSKGPWRKKAKEWEKNIKKEIKIKIKEQEERERQEFKQMIHEYEKEQSKYN